MGVKGLTTYVNNNQDVFLKKYRLHDSNLVIDGNSLCSQLYQTSSCFSAFGGDYDKFALYTKTFFKNLFKCNVVPFVLFDGSYETKKLRTAFNRLRSKINGASKLDPVTQGRLQIFPLLLSHVFKEVLLDMNIKFTVCEFEADDEIASLARYLKCPVLSYDSDFFIYNVKYIPFLTLCKKPKYFTNNDCKIYYLECKIFESEYLLAHFHGLKEETLPLFAALLGNDYIERNVFRNFFAHLKLPKSKSLANEQQRCIQALLKWFQNETFESATEKILGRVKAKRKHKVLTCLKNSIDSYRKVYCKSLKYLDISFEEEKEVEVFAADWKNELLNKDFSDAQSNESGDESSNEEETVLEEDIINENGIDQNTKLADWFVNAIRTNAIPSTYLTLYVHHIFFCSPQAEDYNSDDAFLCALPILRFAFDLLTDYAHQKFIYVARQDCNNYRRITVGRDYSSPRIFDHPFNELCTEKLKKNFHSFIEYKLQKLDLHKINQFPSNLQLYVISIVWWVSNCDVSLSLVYSLFLGYLMLNVIDEKIGYIRSHYHFTNKYSKKIDIFKQNPSGKIEEELFLNKNKVSYEDCIVAAGFLLKFFELDDTIRKRPKTYDTKKIHSLAQFQCCMQQLNLLNILCQTPHENTKFYKFYNGTFIYNVAVKLGNSDEPLSYLWQNLKGANTVIMFLKSIIKLFDDIMLDMNQKLSKSVKKKRKHRKNDNNSNIPFSLDDFGSEVYL